MKWNKISFKLIMCISLVTLVIMTLHLLWNVEKAKERAELELREKARAIATQFIAIRSLVAQDHEQAHEYRHLDPVLLEEHVSMLFGHDIDSNFKELCINSRSPENHPNSYEAKLMEKLSTDPSLKEAWSTTVIDGQRIFTYMAPIYTDDSCLTCHYDGQIDGGIIDLSNEDLQKEMAGAISLSIPMKAYENTVRDDIYAHLIVTSILIVLFITSVYVAIDTMVTRPLGKLRKKVKNITKGNLNQSILDISGPYEIETLASEFNIMAEKLNKSYQELENKVSERTIKLREAYQTLAKKQASLEDANEELRKASKLKSDFLASVSHELKTPLTSITAFNEMLLEGVAGELNQNQREYLLDIRRSSNQLLRSINDVLDMAKLEAGRMELEVSIFNFNDLAQDEIKKVMPVVLMKNQQLMTQISDKLPLVEADYRKIEQVLGNLLGNAVKFTPNSGMITVKAEYFKNESKLVVSVTDTGPGIKEEDKSIIFDAFRQVNGSSTREHRGSGLGLALAKKLIEMHKCDIWVESTYGYGSKFVFNIPVNNTKIYREGG